MLYITSEGINAALNFFVFTLAELALLFLAISFVVSIINSKLPPAKIKELLSGNGGYGLAVSLGVVTPFCSCSTLPMAIGLLKARAAFGPVMAFLFTSPLLNPFVAGLFWISFGSKITLIYAIFVIVLAVVIGMLLGKFQFQRFVRQELLRNNNSEGLCNSGYHYNPTFDTEKKNFDDPIQDLNFREAQCNANQNECDNFISHAKSKSKSGWLSQDLISETFKQFISFLPYMVIGVAMGAILHGFVPTSFFSYFSTEQSIWMIPLAAFVGVFLYVRASTMVPIAMSLMAKGMSMGAVMSLTIGGAGASLPEMIMLKRMFHWPLLVAFVASVFLTACVTGIAIELL